MRFEVSERVKRLFDQRQAEFSAIHKRPLNQSETLAELVNHECESDLDDPDTMSREERT